MSLNVAGKNVVKNKFSVNCCLWIHGELNVKTL